LRATKLARSIGLAIAAGLGEDFETSGFTGEDWRAADLTSAILIGLREQHGPDRLLSTTCLADAVLQVLVATGFPRAAEEYSRVGGEQRRRRVVLSRTMPSLRHGVSRRGIVDSGAAGHDFSLGTGPGILGWRRGSGMGGRSARGGRV